MRALAILLTLALTACAEPVYHSAYNGHALPKPMPGVESRPEPGLGPLAYRAVDKLVGNARLDKRGAILVTTFVSVDDLGRSSTFGRLIGEQTSNRLSQLGYAVKELRLGNALIIREGTGEIILSHDARRLSTSHDAQAIIAGTYAVGGRKVYVTMRLISPVSDRIVSAVDFIAPLDRDIKGLLAEN